MIQILLLFMKITAPQTFPPLQYFPILPVYWDVQHRRISIRASYNVMRIRIMLFCYAFSREPLFCCFAESFGDFRLTLGLFHNNVRSNLGPKPTIDVATFRERHFWYGKHCSLREEGGYYSHSRGSYRRLDCLFRCADVCWHPIQKVCIYFHGSAFLQEEWKNRTSFLFENLHKNPPNGFVSTWNLYNLGFEQSMLDVKFFRDRVVAFSLIFEKRIQRNEIGPLARSLLRIRVICTLPVVLSANIFPLLWPGWFVKQISVQPYLYYWSCYMMCSASFFRFGGVVETYEFDLFFSLINSVFLWMADCWASVGRWRPKYQNHQLH